MKKGSSMKLKRIFEMIVKEDYYGRDSSKDWQYEEISDHQVSYLEEKINDKFGKENVYWYISFIDSFPPASDGSRLFIFCTTDSKPRRSISFRCSNIEGTDLEVDGSLSTHERNTKTIYQSEG